MSSSTPTTQKITYTTLGSSEEFHQAFEHAVAEVEAALPEPVACRIGGAPSASGQSREVRSPIDTRVVVARIEQATAGEASRAVELAAEAFPHWRALGWEQRVAILRRAAERIAGGTGATGANHRAAALMAYEVGKTRLEAMGEVEESADLLRYYATRLEEERGYRREMARMSPAEATESVLLPYGVFGVVAPFNFPMALAAGMIGAALVTGNTVVFKPSQQAPISGSLLCQALWEAGVPEDVLHLVIGPGSEVGEAILGHPRLSGAAFTGSYEVGMRIFHGFSPRWPRPVVVEMGGKNPAIVTASADLAAAADGVARSAFGYSGQKCSACSRVYVESAVADEFHQRLVQRASALVLGNPLRRETFLGPAIDEAAVAKFERYVAAIAEAGGTLLAGGHVRRDGDFAHGYYLEPTIACLPDPDHPFFYEEMFLPLLLVQEVADLDEALARANRAPYGLTAGIFARDAAEVRRFFDRIEAGVLYVNRKSGATTGAWPGINPFGGWKGSGGTGPAALGPHYLLKFLREQSRTINEVTV